MANFWYEVVISAFHVRYWTCKKYSYVRCNPVVKKPHTVTLLVQQFP